ncbi:hypothetical protein CEXT_301941 [Caerostris extrusa]|uniref:Uncharacterized protein n=1 Tax=Caerostris extrusa TaxID=172846 RepID=A0AAV4VVL0_CAEEX|nr:hypothetical protein CEXT_301941 [Caerostris extrusa]
MGIAGRDIGIELMEYGHRVMKYGIGVMEYGYQVMKYGSIAGKRVYMVSGDGMWASPAGEHGYPRKDYMGISIYMPNPTPTGYIAMGVMAYGITGRIHRYALSDGIWVSPARNLGYQVVKYGYGRKNMAIG